MSTVVGGDVILIESEHIYDSVVEQLTLGPGSHGLFSAKDPAALNDAALAKPFVPGSGPSAGCGSAGAE